MQGKRSDEGRSPIFRSVVCRLLADTVSAKVVRGEGKNMLPISDVAAEIEEVARDGTGNYLLLGRRMLSLACQLSRGFPVTFSFDDSASPIPSHGGDVSTYRISNVSNLAVMLYRFSGDTATLKKEREDLHGIRFASVLKKSVSNGVD